MASKRFRAWLLDLPRWSKRALLIGNDFCLLTLALFAAYYLRLGFLYVPSSQAEWLIFAAAPIIGVGIFYLRGLYRLVTRYIGQEAAPRIYITILLAVLTWALFILMTGIPGVPRSVVVLYGLIAAFLVRANRQFAGWILKGIPHATPARFDPRTRVAIYGAGNVGLQLLRALNESAQYKPVAFIDDDKSLWGQVIQRVKVYMPGKIAKLIERDGIEEIFLAIPSASRQRRRNIIRGLEPFPVMVKTVPDLAEIASGAVEVSDLRPIDVEDLLGRDPVPPVADLLERDIGGKAVMITGAGGSIGSELSRQVLRLGPTRLVLYELSEVALYEIEQEVQEIVADLRAAAQEDGAAPPDIEIVSVLGSVLDRGLLAHTIQSNGIETIYHAAAYKHVPIVESNPVTGLRNNTFGTLAVAETAKELGVARLVLISTDKAVRPTSIMGASKRLAELILQAMAADEGTGTVFTMVRFGNVLDSSGSVVRRFRKQIRQGGPITVTHPNIIRYFMSIPEAGQLVIQAGAMAEGGDVFVLDMGSPVKIDDLARTMVHLSGLEVQDDDHPDGDIAIDYVGLRQGEKLYEELLIGENTTGTQHPRIMKNSEPMLGLAALKTELAQLERAVEDYDLAGIHAILKRTVEGYTQADEPDYGPQAKETEDWATVSRTLH